MASLTIHASNLRALQRVQWSLSGTNVLVGANGVGKTTLVLMLKLIRSAYDRGLPEAVTTVLGGSYGLLNINAPADEPVEIGLEAGSLRWRLTLIPRGASVDSLTNESLHDGDTLVFSRDSLGNFEHRGERLTSDDRLALRAISDAQRDDPAVERLADIIKKIRVFHDPDLWGIRNQGSNSSLNRFLHARGSNAITMLRRWSQEKPNRHRHDFVVESLRAAFPSLISDIDFEEAGQTVVARVYHPGNDQSTSLRAEANGVLAMLVLACEIATVDQGGLVAIDEPENSLHPYAIRSFFRRAQSWIAKHDAALLLTTHSTVILDELQGSPERVFVMRRVPTTMPERLDLFRERDWLSNFRLGTLYADDEIGSNRDDA